MPLAFLVCVLTFPTANRTLVYDVTEGFWHERAWTDPSSGLLNRVRANCMALAYGVNVAGDWQNGNIYVLDLVSIIFIFGMFRPLCY